MYSIHQKQKVAECAKMQGERLAVAHFRTAQNSYIPIPYCCHHYQNLMYIHVQSNCRNLNAVEHKLKPDICNISL